MLKILIKILIPLSVLWIAFFRFTNNIYNFLIVIFLCILGALYYVSEDVVTEKMVKKASGENVFFSVKAGYITKKNAETFQRGRLVITQDSVCFYKRFKDIGGCLLLYSCPVEEVVSYSLGKVDEYHTGVILKLQNGEEVLFSSRQIDKKESELKKALNW